MGDKILDPALGLNQRIGAKALDRRGAGKDRAGAATLRNEATGKILIRCRRLGFPSDPFAQIPCAPPRKGAIAVDSAKVRQMRSEERSEGKGCGSTCSYRWSPVH